MGFLNGRRSRFRLSRRVSAATTGAAMVVGVTAYKATPAAACPGANGIRSYAGQVSTSTNYDGIAARIFNPGIQTAPIQANNEALAFHISEFYSAGTASRWIQTGMVRGLAPGNTWYTAQTPYLEISGMDGYAFSGRPDLRPDMGSNPVFKISFSGNNNTYAWYFDGYMGSTWLGVGGMPYRFNSIIAESEARTNVANRCLGYSAQGFGSNGTPNYDPNYAMKNKGNGFGWSEWTGSVNGFDFTNYVYTLKHANSYFDTQGIQQ